MAVQQAERPEVRPRPGRISDAGRRAADGVVIGVFVLSGAAGLVYQVVWSRQLVLVFGNTTEAIGAIVTAFMAGLGLGGLVGGLIAPRLRRPLAVYGVVELLVGATAVFVPLGFTLIEGVYHGAYDNASPGQLTLVRLVLSLATVTPVTFLMGLTLPLLTRHMVTSLQTAGAHMGRLYSANTLGAMAGTLVSGLVLIELIGLSATAHVAVALNAIAGCVAVLFAVRMPPAVPAQTGDVSQPPSPEDGAARRLRALLYVGTFVSGFVALSLEVLWTRMLAEGTGSRIYIFVVILAIYLLGIGGGGAVYRRVSSPERDTPAALALAFVGMAVSAAITVPLATMWITNTNIARAAILLPATFCMGYAFPLAARLLTRTPAHGSRSIGVLYAWNTVGSILGSLAAAFVLAGTLGTNGSILVLAAADALVALLLLYVGGAAVRLTNLRLIAVAAAVAIVPPMLVATGSPLLLTATERYVQARGLPLHHTEDRIATVDAVGGPPSKRRLYVTGTAMTALSVDTKLMAYIPRLLRPNAQHFLDICFGMGTTFRSALLLGMDVDAVDLSPSVPQQMPTFYPDANQFLHSPHARVITADGRNYVRNSSRTYDVISVDPPPPIESAGTVVLYTKEFYADAHARLNPGGLMLQWLYFGVDLEQLREHLATFRSAFPHMLVLLSPRHGGMYMLGSDSPLTWNDSQAAALFESPSAMRDISDAPDYQYLPNQPWPVLMDEARWLSDDQVDRFTGNVQLITDDRPLTEYYLLHLLFASGNHHSVTYAQLRALAP